MPDEDVLEGADADPSGVACIDAGDELIMVPEDDVEVRQTEDGVGYAIRSDAAIASDVTIPLSEVR